MQFHSIHFHDQSSHFNLCDEEGLVTLSHAKSIYFTPLGDDFLPDLFLLRIVLAFTLQKI